MALPNLYESTELHKVTGPAIRPGGLELTTRAVTECGFSRGDRVLDIGCGMGASIDFIHQAHHLDAVGLDRSGMLLNAGRSGVSLPPRVRGAAEDLPFPGQFFRGVLCECMLSLSDDPGAVLAEAWRVLAPGGHLVLADVYARIGPGGMAPVDPLPGGGAVDTCLAGAVSRPRIERRVARAGFALVLWEDHTPHLKRLAAQLVLEFGSMKAFWEAMGGCGREMGTRNLSAPSLPGYYLLVARRGEG